MSLLVCFLNVLWATVVTLAGLALLVLVIWGVCRMLSTLEDGPRDRGYRLKSGAALALVPSILLATLITYFSVNEINVFSYNEVASHILPKHKVQTAERQ